MTLLGCHDPAIGEADEGFYICTNGFDDRGADEDRVERIARTCGLLQEVNIEPGFKGIQLAPEGIPFDGDIHQLEQGLLSVGIFREKNCTGASAPYSVGKPKFPYGFE